MDKMLGVILTCKCNVIQQAVSRSAEMIEVMYICQSVNKIKMICNQHNYHDLIATLFVSL